MGIDEGAPLLRDATPLAAFDDDAPAGYPGDETAIRGGGTAVLEDDEGPAGESCLGGVGNGDAALLASRQDDGMIGAVEDLAMPLATEEEDEGAAKVPLREALPLLTVMLRCPLTGLGGSFLGSGGGLLSMNLLNSYFARMNLSNSLSLSTS